MLVTMKNVAKLGLKNKPRSLPPPKPNEEWRVAVVLEDLTKAMNDEPGEVSSKKYHQKQQQKSQYL